MELMELVVQIEKQGNFYKNFNLIVLILFLSILIGCSTVKTNNEYYISTLENIKTLPISKEDSVKILKVKLSAENALKDCHERYGPACLDDIERLTYEAQFKGGIDKFREILFENFTLPKTAKTGENRIRVLIGTKDNLEKIEIIKYTDNKTKESIEKIFGSEELNKWKSKRVYNIPLKQQFEISIFVKGK